MHRQKGPAASTRASGRPLHGVCFKIMFAGRNTGFGPQSPGFSRELCKKYSRCKAALSSSADEGSILPIGFGHNKVGAVLCLKIDLCDILPDDAKAEQLQAADEDDDTDGRGPACHRVTKQQAAYHDEQDGQNRAECHSDTEPGGNT